MNSKPLETTDVYADYWSRFYEFDKLRYYLGVYAVDGDLKFGVALDERDDGTLQRHHVWSLNRRPNLRSALIVTNNETHRWLHANPQQARVMCVLTKLLKRNTLGEPDEFTISEIDEAAGKSALGMISTYDFTGDERFAKWQAECLSRLADISLEVV